MRFEDANIIIPDNELVAAVNKMKEKGLEAPVVDAPVKEGAVEQIPMDRALAQAQAAGISLGGHGTTAPDTLSIAKSVESGRVAQR